MELRFRESALAHIRIFVAHYEEGFFELYSDSGIWNEDEIIRSVRKDAHALFDTLLDTIALRLSGKRVLGRKLSRRWHELRIRIGTRFVFVQYSEDLGEDIRWIESIAIDRKPIIF